MAFCWCKVLMIGLWKFPPQWQDYRLVFLFSAEIFNCTFFGQELYEHLFRALQSLFCYILCNHKFPFYFYLYKNNSIGYVNTLDRNKILSARYFSCLQFWLLDKLDRPCRICVCFCKRVCEFGSFMFGLVHSADGSLRRVSGSGFCSTSGPALSSESVLSLIYYKLAPLADTHTHMHVHTHSIRSCTLHCFGHCWS